MKLIRLKITDNEGFRSLQKGFEIYFTKDFDFHDRHEFSPNILAGPNGSGKSNVLEALANIFYHLDCIYSEFLPDNFVKDDDNQNGFDSAVSIVDSYELEYYIFLSPSIGYKTYKDVHDFPITGMQIHVSVTKVKESAPVVKWVNLPNDLDREIKFDKTFYRKLLPKFVIGYSSGENEILSLPFYKTRFLHFDEYADKLRYEEPFGYPPKSEGRLIFLDQDLSQAILLSNLLMISSASKEKMKSSFYDFVGIDDVEEFRLIICHDRFLELHEDILRDRKITFDENYEGKDYLIELTSNLSKSIEVLKKCATSYNYLNVVEENREDSREYLILDYKVTDATKLAFQFHFSREPLELFQLFQILLELNTYIVSEKDKKTVYESRNIFINNDIYPYPLEEDRILRFKNLGVKKSGIEKPLFTKELSDGEHQFLHTIGLCLLFKNENVLFLLDEPETHFNPDWKANFISNLRHSFSDSNESVVREMIITTHSPYLISDSESKYVHVFEKDPKSNTVLNYFPEFQTLGASINKITIELFKTPITIGKHAYSIIEEILDRSKNGEAPDQLIMELENRLGQSVEKTLLIHRLLK